MLCSAGSTPNIHRRPVTVRTGFRGDARDYSEPDILERFFGKPCDRTDTAFLRFPLAATELQKVL